MSEELEHVVVKSVLLTAGENDPTRQPPASPSVHTWRTIIAPTRFL
jgi:hypothetical protein